MRILYIAHRIPYPPNKGEKIRALWELRELCREHVVDLFCFCDDPEDRRFISELKNYCDRLYIEDLSFLGSRARALWALLTGRPFSVGFFQSPAMATQIDSALRSNAYDRVFVYSSSMAQYAEQETVPRVLDLVDVDSDKWLQYAERSRWPWSWLWRKEAQHLGIYEEQLVRHYPISLVCTDSEAELLRSQAPVGRIEVLQNFIDAAYYDPTGFIAPGHIRELQPYVVFSGSMDYRPNVDAALFFCREVLPLIRQAMPELRVVIAGRNPHPSVAALGSDPAIRVTGSVADMRPYIWGASAAVVPMRIARGVQNKILEALASGTPVVSTSVAAMALPRAVRSLLRVGDTPQAIAASVLDLVKGRTDQASRAIRVAFREYVEGLNLNSKLRQIVLDPLCANDNAVPGQPDAARHSVCQTTLNGHSEPACRQ